jgi:homopolymeric O-antigen transport system permease protein
VATSERSAPSPARPGDRAATPDGRAGAAKPVLEVVGGPGRLSAASFRELWAFREVLWAFVVRQVKVRYKQAAVGVLWAVFQPVLAALLFALFLGRYAEVPSEGVPYLVFALAGMAAWSYFSSAAGSGSESLVANQGLLRKLYFPREVLPVAAVGAAVLDLAIGLGVLVVAAALYGIAPAVSWVALPLPLAILILAAGAFAVGLSAVNVYYRDVRHALPFLLQVGLFASAVVYPLSVLPASWRELYAIANPVAGAIDGIRRIVLHGTWPDASITAGALAWSAFLLVAGYALFKRLERGFADRV